MMSSSDLDGDIAFDKVLDRWESAIASAGAERERTSQAQTALRQAERERDSARENAIHWQGVAETRNDEIGRLHARLARFRQALETANVELPVDPPEKSTDDAPF